jgi:uncharacterized protein YjlB
VFTTLLFLSAAKLTAGDIGDVHCQAGEGYVYLYQSADNFQVVADLECGQQTEINYGFAKQRSGESPDG